MSIIPITSYLPSMFAVISRNQNPKKETKEEKNARIKYQQIEAKINDKNLCKEFTCLNCGKKGLKYSENLTIGVCDICKEEFSVEFIKYNSNKTP